MLESTVGTSLNDNMLKVGVQPVSQALATAASALPEMPIQAA